MKLVSDSSYGHEVAWNPWRALRAREHIELVFHPIAAEAGGGAYYRAPDGVAVILLDKNLHRRDRNAILAHELVHDELGGGREALVHKTVARRLVPLDELAAFVIRTANLGEAVTALEVAEQFDVPASVAERALALLKDIWCADG